MTLMNAAYSQIDKEDGLKSLEYALMMQQYLTWSINTNFYRRRKTRMLQVERVG